MPVAGHKDRAQPVASVNGSEAGGRSWIPDLCLQTSGPAQIFMFSAEQAGMAWQSMTKASDGQ